MLLKEERYLVTGSMDQELRVWKLNWTADSKDEDKLTRQLEIVKLEETDNVEDSSVSMQYYSNKVNILDPIYTKMAGIRSPVTAPARDRIQYTSRN